MDSKGAPRSPTQRLGAVWSAKWAPNELSERRKIIKKACVFTVKLAFSRFGKDIIRDERFGLKKEGLTIRRRLGNPLRNAAGGLGGRGK